MPTAARIRVAAAIFLWMAANAATDGDEPAAANAHTIIDATTLHGKVLCGYQGWFRCPGDPAGQGWRHWSRDGRRLTPKTLTVEMWPEISEYEQTYPAPGFTSDGGTAARLFSSADTTTVALHFRWMQQYGIDGAFVQRFLVAVGDPSQDRVLENVRAAARNSGRTFAVGYDLSGMRADQLYERLTSDWKQLVDVQRIDRDERYLHQDGRPVLFVWGFFSDRFDASLAHGLLDFFAAEGPYRACLVGGCPWTWRRESDPEWARAYRRFDVLSPWNVGNAERIDGRLQAAFGSWKEDLQELQQCGKEFLPVVYPGFGWTHLKGPGAARATLPRAGGEFYWKQFLAAEELHLDMVYVAMFDEVDEGTAIFKVSNSPPPEADFQTYQGLPADWYLRLTGAGAELLRGERKKVPGLPLETTR